MSELEAARIESELRGKTLLVYWYMIKHSDVPAGARRVQRALGFSSPSISFHHLGKLVNLGLVRKNERGEYILNQEVKVGIFRQFIRIGRLVFPRYLFYAVLVTTMLLTYILLYPQNLSSDNLIALMFGLTAASVLWFEAFRLLRELPF